MVRAGRDALELLPSPQREAARRLAPLCIAVGALLCFAGLARFIGMRQDPEAMATEGYHLGGTVHFFALAAMCFAMAAFARRSSRPARVLAVGLVFEVLLCFGIGVLDFVMYDMFARPPKLSFIAVAILTFPIAIPTTMRRRVITTVACAATLPLAALVAHLALDRPAPPPSLVPYLPTFATVAVALFIASVVHQLSTQASEARRLGSYELIERLGAGGMGEVWRARHRRLVRPAAVKLINPSLLGGDRDAARRRFDREARATSALRSPHTVALFDYGVADDGVFYYAMELLDGIDLSRLVETFGPLPPGRAIHLLEQVCRSLEEAHGVGFIHRDIKPANLVLCRQGAEDDFVKVLDFGLVKEVDGDGDVTDEATARGTPAFMAPETVLGDPIDGRTDLYALGCVAYWLLSGRYVFEDKTPIMLAVRHAESPPPPLSDAVEGLPGDLEALVMACLAKDPGDRPASAAVMRQELGSLASAGSWTDRDARGWWLEHGARVDAMLRPAESPRDATGLADAVTEVAANP
jgi:serine/threonine-protein kinase